MEHSYGKRYLLTWPGGLFLFGLTLLTYYPVWQAGFIWDDDRYVTNNYLLIAPDGWWRIWFSLDAPSQYFPLTYTIFRIEYWLWGLNPAGYHLVNIFLHSANALLVWWILARLKVPGAWLAAAIFALHPVQVESVAWISELKNVLMGFFFLLSLAAWIEYADPASKRLRRFYLAALIFFLLALFAKSTACTLPAVLLLIIWLKEKPIGRQTLLEIIPFVVLALGIGLVAIWWEKYHQGTRSLVSLAPTDRLLIASRAVWFYLSKLFWPSNLTFIYPQWRINPVNPVAYLWLIAGIGAALIVYWARRYLGRGIEVGALFFVTTLGPLLSFIMLYTFRYTFVADHYQYLACIGPIALASAGLSQVGRTIKQPQWFVVAAGFLILACLAVLTARQSSTYKNAETLWRTTIARNPACWMAHNNLGAIQFEKGNSDAAIAQYERSLHLKPDQPEAHYNFAMALLQKGEIDQAIEHCRTALELEPNEPDARLVLGNALAARGDLDGAIDQYVQALNVRPEDSKAHYNLGLALSAKGENELAAHEYEKARQFAPREPR